MTRGGPPLIVDSAPAGADLSTKQYHFVKLSSGTAVLCTAATDLPIGVLQNKPVAGREAEWIALGPSPVIADGALTEGALIGPSADSQADAKVPGTDVTEYVCGRVLQAASAADEIVDAYINCVNPHRAA